MTTFIQIMSGENKADTDRTKGFIIVPLGNALSYEFRYNEHGRAMLVVTYRDLEENETYIDGSCYIYQNGILVVAFDPENPS